MASTATVPVFASRQNEEALAYAGLSLTALFWAGGFIAGKFALTELTPLTVATWRYVAASAILLPFAVRQRPRAGLDGVGLPLAVLMIAGGVVYPWLFLAALARTSATNTALLIALNPVVTTLLAPLVGERLNARRLFGVALALVGAVTVITRGDWGALAALELATGDLLALAAACTWAVFNLTARGVSLRLTPAFTNFVIYAWGAVALAVLAHGEAPLAQLGAASSTAVGGILGLAVLSSVLAGQLFMTGVRVVGVSRTVVFVHLVPVLTALLSAVLLDEPFTRAQAVGGAAVLAGVWSATRGGGTPVTGE